MNHSTKTFQFLQVDVIGISISEIVHPQDISELASVFKTQGKDSQHGQLANKTEALYNLFFTEWSSLNKKVARLRQQLFVFTVFDRSDPLKRNFVIRMRCAFTPSVRSIARCSNFKVTSLSVAGLLLISLMIPPIWAYSDSLSFWINLLRSFLTYKMSLPCLGL